MSYLRSMKIPYILIHQKRTSSLEVSAWLWLGSEWGMVFAQDLGGVCWCTIAAVEPSGIGRAEDDLQLGDQQGDICSPEWRGDRAHDDQSGTPRGLHHFIKESSIGWPAWPDKIGVSPRFIFLSSVRHTWRVVSQPVLSWSFSIPKKIAPHVRDIITSESPETLYLPKFFFIELVEQQRAS